MSVTATDCAVTVVVVAGVGAVAVAQQINARQDGLSCFAAAFVYEMTINEQSGRKREAKAVVGMRF